MHTKQSELGIGQTGFASHRYNRVSYLPWMYMYNFVFLSKVPLPIVTYDTLIYPFDYFIWSFCATFTLVMFMVLATFQGVWAYASGESNPVGWLFQGIFLCKLLTPGDFVHEYFIYLIG